MTKYFKANNYATSLVPWHLAGSTCKQSDIEQNTMLWILSVTLIRIKQHILDTYAGKQQF